SFAYSVSSAGDVNGDGYDDIVVGAPNWDYTRQYGYTGRAYIYYGSAQGIKSTPDVTLQGSGKGDGFGYRVLGAGKLNSDKYDDIAIGAYYYGANRGRVYVYYGAATGIGTTPNVTLEGEEINNFFSCSIASADVNGDSYMDLVVGAYGNNSSNGKVYIYHGSDSGIQTKPNVTIEGMREGGEFGRSVANAGDVNKDLYEDIIIGAQYADDGKGNVYIYHGSQNGISNISPNKVLYGEGSYTYFGFAVGGNGDINRDGYDDVIVGAPSYKLSSGRAYIFFGSQYGIEAEYKYAYTGETTGERFGSSLLLLDVNNNGYDDVLIGSPDYSYKNGAVYIYNADANGLSKISNVFIKGEGDNNYFGGSIASAGDVDNNMQKDVLIGARGYNLDTGRAYLYFPPFVYPQSPTIKIEGKTLWGKDGDFYTLEKAKGFQEDISNFVAANIPTGSDSFGNSYCDVPLQITTVDGNGKILLTNTSITYNYIATIYGIQSEINKYISAHKKEGEILYIPLNFTSHTAGKIEVVDVNITFDNAPTFLQIPTLSIFEDSLENNVIDLWNYVRDDKDPVRDLIFNVLSYTNDSYLLVGIFNGHFLSIDASTGTANDNWTGETEITVSATDTSGLMGRTNITVEIKNLNDAPVIISQYVEYGKEDMPYTYSVRAVDGDNDSLVYSLELSPKGMVINETSGIIIWFPKNADVGTHNVIVSVSDGKVGAKQIFSINVEGVNDPPIIKTIPDVEIEEGSTFNLDLSPYIEDEDTPADAIVITEDSNFVTVKGFTLIFSYPIGYGGSDEKVKITVRDDGGNFATKELIVRILKMQKPIISIDFPLNDTTVENTITLSGKAYVLNATLLRVLIRIDDGSWDNASGLYEWSYKLDTKKLKNGQHKISIRAEDDKKNIALETIFINVDNPVKPPPEQKGIDMRIVGGIIVAIIIGIFGGYAIGRVRARYVKEKVPEKPEELPVSPYANLIPIRTEAYEECIGCKDWIKKNTVAYKCICGKIYHEICAGKIEVCISCNRMFREKLEEKEEIVLQVFIPSEEINCDKCKERIISGSTAFKCYCGAIYHEKCAGELGECIKCNLRFKLPVEKVEAPAVEPTPTVVEVPPIEPQVEAVVPEQVIEAPPEIEKKIPLEHFKITVPLDCDKCKEKIGEGAIAFKCSCGAIYHEKCAGELIECIFKERHSA
ncbi:MAG: FG-GAP-like repeat-containing protein, partial [Candidatus Thermoplasmatota archaeon]